MQCAQVHVAGRGKARAASAGRERGVSFTPLTTDHSPVGAGCGHHAPRTRAVQKAPARELGCRGPRRDNTEPSCLESGGSWVTAWPPRGVLVPGPGFWAWGVSEPGPWTDLLLLQACRAARTGGGDRRGTGFQVCSIGWGRANDGDHIYI